MTAAAVEPAGGLRRAVALFGGRIAWALLFVVVAVTLAVGSARPASPSSAARASYLDTVIKCPSCDGLSIGQSDAGVAIALRNEVRNLVDAGWSTPRIEARIESQYGTDEILVPPSGIAWWLPTLVAVAATAAVGAVLSGSRRRRRRTASAEDESLVRSEMERLSAGT